VGLWMDGSTSTGATSGPGAHPGIRTDPLARRGAQGLDAREQTGAQGPEEGGEEEGREEEGREEEDRQEEGHEKGCTEEAEQEEGRKKAGEKEGGEEEGPSPEITSGIRSLGGARC